MELTLDEPVDAVFSNAVFHWVPDHDRLFARMFAALKPGGRLVAQCGGAGNVERFHAAARAVAERRAVRRAPGGLGGTLELRHAPSRPPSASSAPASTRSRPGSSRTRSTPDDRPGYLARSASATTCCACPRSCATAFVADVVEHSDPELDYVRLNIDARRPTDSVRRHG